MATESFLANKLYVEVIDDENESALSDKISSLTTDGYGDAFFVGDLGQIVYKHNVWLSELPRVEPFYAVNCNDNAAVLSVLAKLGIGFACVNKAEMQKVAAIDVCPSQIVYANSCKLSSHIVWAAHHDINFMTFDSDAELFKIKAKHPNAKLIMQVRISGCDDVSEAGVQSGCHVKQVLQLLTVCKQLELDVIGLSFQLGSNCGDQFVYTDAIASARAVFDLAAVEGFNFQLLDIGGGFPDDKSTGLSFQQIGAALRPALDQHFPACDGVRIIAESGRYFVSSAFTLAVNIVARRPLSCDTVDPDDIDGCGIATSDYYINEGVYGSFGCLLSGLETVEPSLVNADRFVGEPCYKSRVFGPTLDDLDCVVPHCMLPQLETGDWLVFTDMGAYTMNTAAYLGREWTPECHYIMKQHLWSQLCQCSGCGGGCNSGLSVTDRSFCYECDR